MRRLLTILFILSAGLAQTALGGSITGTVVAEATGSLKDIVSRDPKVQIYPVSKHIFSQTNTWAASGSGIDDALPCAKCLIEQQAKRVIMLSGWLW